MSTSPTNFERVAQLLISTTQPTLDDRYEMTHIQREIRKAGSFLLVTRTEAFIIRDGGVRYELPWTAAVRVANSCVVVAEHDYGCDKFVLKCRL